MSDQTAGLALAAVGACLLWSAWALVLAGLLLLVLPEVTAVRARSREVARR
jgi:hypothetical protein